MNVQIHLAMAGASLVALAVSGHAGVWAGEAGPGSVGIVSHVKVLSDKVRDVSSMEAWKRSFIKDGATDREKAQAVFRSVVMFRYQDAPPIEFLHEGCVHDPIKTFNVYGYGMCCCASSNVEALARYAGLDARGWAINAHSVPEVFYENAWHMLDTSLVNYFPKPDGQIASVAEIAAAVKGWYEKHPEYRKNDAKLREFHQSGGWMGWKQGPELLTKSPFFDWSGWWPAKTHGWYATMQEYDGSGGTPFIYEYGYSQGYEVNIQLRPCPSSVMTADVHFGFPLFGIEEDVQRVGVFDDPAQEHEDALVAGPPGLGHVVGDDHDRVFPPQLVQEGLDPFGAFGVQGRTGLVHENHPGLERQEPGDAELLLLFERQVGAPAFEPAAQLVPELHVAQGRLGHRVQLVSPKGAPPGVDADSEEHVFVDRNRQRIGPLENHAHGLAELAERNARVVDVLAEHGNLAGRGHVPVTLVDPVEAPQERRLAAPRRADESRDQSRLDLHAHVFEGLKVAVPKVQAVGGDAEVGTHQPNSPFTNRSVSFWAGRLKTCSVGPTSISRESLKKAV